MDPVFRYYKLKEKREEVHIQHDAENLNTTFVLEPILALMKTNHLYYLQYFDFDLNRFEFVGNSDYSFRHIKHFYKEVPPEDIDAEIEIIIAKNLLELTNEN